MSSYFAQVSWQRQAEEVFTDNQYSRLHQWQFDEGVSMSSFVFSACRAFAVFCHGGGRS
jgi:hypothetical protein